MSMPWSKKARRWTTSPGLTGMDAQLRMQDALAQGALCLKIGALVHVKLIATNVERGFIDFAFVD